MIKDCIKELRKLPFFEPVLGLASFLFMCVNVCFWSLMAHLVAPLLLGSDKHKAMAEDYFDRLFNGWVAANEWWFKQILDVHWDLDDSMVTDFNRWSLMISNHRSWVDVFILLAQIQGKRPLPRVFMKQALFWMPFVGTATYIMGFPYMKRYSKETLAKKPHLAGKDLATTKRSCERLLNRPNSILTFVEGTRFTQAKQEAQASQYQHLLKPKAGGVGFILQTMPQRINSITDLNVLYDQANISGWDVLCGRLSKAKVMVREVALPESFLSAEFRPADQDRDAFFEWFNLYWHDKDVRMGHQLDALKASEASPEKAVTEGKT
ncbi:acetyltransferase [Marinomonas sp. THO17]|uniref:acetyltransferase n=1 Tax=Marinomonas sp. THO17 TaxID=3149048 RepID=UPI00336C2E8B